MKVGDKYERKGFNSTVQVKEIQTHSKVKGKTTKLEKPIITIEYLNSDKKDFTTYEYDIQRMVDFGCWVKIK